MLTSEQSEADEGGDSISISSTASGGSWMLAEQGLTDQSTGDSESRGPGGRVHGPEERVYGDCSRSLQVLTSEQAKDSTSTRPVNEMSGDRDELGSAPAVVSP